MKWAGAQKGKGGEQGGAGGDGGGGGGKPKKEFSKTELVSQLLQSRVTASQYY